MYGRQRMRPVQQPSIAMDVVQKGEGVIERIKPYEVSTARLR